jgi:2'-hydroxyisoflavone reductase
MKILILGGTVFLGRHLVDAALAQGHDVTIFHRGLHAWSPIPDVEQLRGDRTNDLTALRGRQWDRVIDTSGYVPGTVRASSQLLANQVTHYTFLSSISVYADFHTPASSETAPVSTITSTEVQAAEQIQPPARGTVARSYGDHYGALKALCEQALMETLPGRSLAIRPGLIVGPYDYSDRFPYWPRRVARGGEVLAPGRPERPLQFIDARDLAEWIVRMSETEQIGVYNASGPNDPLSMQQLLEQCKQVTRSDATFCWLDDAFLLAEGVVPWSQMPLWIPDEANMPGFLSVNCSKAFAAGLTFRPLTETIHDTWVWDMTRPSDIEWEAGLDAEREAQLLHTWHRREKTNQ